MKPSSGQADTTSRGLSAAQLRDAGEHCECCLLAGLLRLCSIMPGAVQPEASPWLLTFNLYLA